MSINKIILVGNLGRDPEVRATASGLSVCNFSLATTERYQGRDGQRHEQTEWHNIVVWGKQAELCRTWLSVGAELVLDGAEASAIFSGRSCGPRRASALAVFPRAHARERSDV